MRIEGDVGVAFSKYKCHWIGSRIAPAPLPPGDVISGGKMDRKRGHLRDFVTRSCPHRRRRRRRPETAIKKTVHVSQRGRLNEAEDSS